mmetsp:Transcript_40734/g.128438  ORF Transcript_40734/g.128438 Transcript_40734/m.128438 type:complete len:217 (+) Transcript_40734:289-939(+)
MLGKENEEVASHPPRLADVVEPVQHGAMRRVPLGGGRRAESERDNQPRSEPDGARGDGAQERARPARRLGEHNLLVEARADVRRDGVHRGEGLVEGDAQAGVADAQSARGAAANREPVDEDALDGRASCGADVGEGSLRVEVEGELGGAVGGLTGEQRARLPRVGAARRVGPLRVRGVLLGGVGVAPEGEDEDGAAEAEVILRPVRHVVQHHRVGV